VHGFVVDLHLGSVEYYSPPGLTFMTCTPRIKLHLQL